MNNNYLKELLKEYENKHQKAILDLNNRKTQLYQANPKLQEIEDKINSLGISTAKTILENNNLDIINNLKNEQASLKEQQKNILKDLGIDEEFFKPNFECKYCNDTGYITNNYETTMCNCLKQKLFDIEYNKSNIYNLEKDNFSKFDYNLYSDEINKEKYGSNISPRDNIKLIRNIAEKFINDFDNPDSKNLLFTGNTGLRKNLHFKLYCK